MSRAGRVGWRNPKKYVDQNLAPTQRIFDLADAFFLPGGMPDTIWGSEITESAQHGPIYPDTFLCWDVFSSHIKQENER